MEKPSPPSFTWMFPVVLVVALAVFGVGLFLALKMQAWAMLAAGCACLVAVLIAWPLTLTLVANREAALKHQEEVAEPIVNGLEQLALLLNMISEQQLLSDRAKAVAFREKDRDALRRAIREEIATGDFEAAQVLAGEMETAFGYKSEAERLREEIEDRRQENSRRQLGEVWAVIERLCRAEQWREAREEADKAAARFPENPQIVRLPIEVDNRREAHKKQLMGSWNDAVARHDVDGSIEILKQLDLYLSPAEAESMQETARSVFKEKLNNLRMQFSIAVQDHKWSEAVRIGDAIILEFPNAKIAQEVKEKMETLRARAAVPAEAGA